MEFLLKSYENCRFPFCTTSLFQSGTFVLRIFPLFFLPLFWLKKLNFEHSIVKICFIDKFEVFKFFFQVFCVATRAELRCALFQNESLMKKSESGGMQRQKFSDMSEKNEMKVSTKTHSLKQMYRRGKFSIDEQTGYRSFRGQPRQLKLGESGTSCSAAVWQINRCLLSHHSSCVNYLNQIPLKLDIYARIYVTTIVHWIWHQCELILLLEALETQNTTQQLPYTGVCTIKCALLYRLLEKS